MNKTVQLVVNKVEFHKVSLIRETSVYELFGISQIQNNSFVQFISYRIN